MRAGAVLGSFTRYPAGSSSMGRAGFQSGPRSTPGGTADAVVQRHRLLPLRQVYHPDRPLVAALEPHHETQVLLQKHTPRIKTSLICSSVASAPRRLSSLGGPVSACSRMS